jgi:hypothetical protein
LFEPREWRARTHVNARTNDDGAGLACESAGMAACVDPSWAEWTMPNVPADTGGTGSGAAASPNHYSDNGDGTVTDNVTGLMWEQMPAPVMFVSKTGPTAYVQAQALSYCDALTLAGYGNWRLPTIIELASLVDTGVTNAMLNPDYFTWAQGLGLSFWSATPVAGSPSLAWIFDFAVGYPKTQDAKAIVLGVACVR